MATALDVVVVDAEPFASATVLRLVAPLLEVTEPCGTPAEEPTSAVMVAVQPTATEFEDRPTTVVVGIAMTVAVIAAEFDVALFGSPT